MLVLDIIIMRASLLRIYRSAASAGAINVQVEVMEGIANP
jgi:hypothetical protein